ncbi:MAG: translocation/assembly module TamB domain-containing protein, partial [Bacteroidales bacterium]|nr:translocation/assembly module TamB domain-containing protein [Bacteroidales bacterium]
EFQVALSTQLLDNRITINSDLGYRGAAATNSGNEQITGDFNIEYKLTEKIRFKAFNRYNNPYTGRQADYTQGIGLLYRQEFNKLADLFKKKNRKSDAKKEENTLSPDSE